MNMKRVCLVLFLVLAVVGVMFAQSYTSQGVIVTHGSRRYTTPRGSTGTWNHYFIVQNNNNTLVNVVISYTILGEKKIATIAVNAKDTKNATIGRFGVSGGGVIIHDVSVTPSGSISAPR